MRIPIVLLSILILAGCPLKSVRQADLDSWVGMPVEALDMQPLFLTMRLERRMTTDGIEVRNYVNEANVSMPVGGLIVTKRIACNNIFYIHDNYVMEYRPTGRFYTDATTRPPRGYTPWQ